MTKIIVIEGPDGVGKTTLAEYLAQQLPDAVYVSFPGKEQGVGKFVYEYHHQYADISPTALQTLHIAAHIDAVERIIVPLLEQGKTVVLDRSYISTLVYGSVYGADVATVMDLVDAEETFWKIHGLYDHGVLQVFIHQETPFEVVESQVSERWLELADKYLHMAVNYDPEGEKVKTIILRKEKSIEARAIAVEEAMNAS